MNTFKVMQMNLNPTKKIIVTLHLNSWVPHQQ